MPKYTAVAPTFTPIDYATRIKPLEEYKQEYDKRMDALDEQSMLAEAIGGLIDPNNEEDKELLRTYTEYSNKMNNTAMDLLHSGDLGSSRRALSELRRDYASKLIPIQQAYNARAEEGKAFRDMKRKDPSYRGNDPLQNSLSSYMHGNMPDGFGISGDKVYNELFNDSKAQISRMRQVVKDWGLDDSTFGGQYFVQQIAQGYKAEDVIASLATMAGKSLEEVATQKDVKEMADAYKYMQSALNRAYTGFGVDNLANSKDREYILTRALDGILAGMTYDFKTDVKENKDFIDKYKQSLMNNAAWDRKFKAALYGYDPKTGTASGKPKSGSGSAPKESKKGIVHMDEDGKIISEHDTRQQASEKGAFSPTTNRGKRRQPMTQKSITESNITDKLSPETIDHLADHFNIEVATDEGKAKAVAKYIIEHGIEIINGDVKKEHKDGTFEWITGETTYAHPGTQQQAEPGTITVTQDDLSNAIKALLEESDASGED